MKYLKEFTYFINEISDNELKYRMAGFKHDEKKINIDKAYHVTPVSNVKTILNKGLLPNQPENEEPNAIFLTLDLLGAITLARLLKLSKNYKDDFALLEIDCKGLTIYKDPFSVAEYGAYTRDQIPSDKLKVKTIIDYDIIRSQKNYSKFMDWWFYHRIPDKPDFVEKFNLKKYK